ncbi:MAG: Sir2 family NAD-dependent protein deacetylase [Thermomicrobiales bacterium]
MTFNESEPHYSDVRTAGSEKIAALAEAIQAHSRIAVFTGAGISTESGIPDYRGPNGVWARNAIPHIDSVQTDDASRREMWAYRREHYPLMLARRPNSGHVALADLERMGNLIAIITQNIDGLHQKAGSDPDRVIELHGSTHNLRCSTCGRVYEGSAIQQRLEDGEADPRCEFCGGPLRTATVFFGEALPPIALQTAVAVARASDLMLVIGSSLAVNPAARLPTIARENGAKVIIINREPTPQDAVADLVIHADAGPTLTGSIDLVDSMRKEASR